MPVKKTTRSKKAKDSIASPDDSPSEVSAEDHGSADQENQGDREVQGNLETSDRQLFFSTDGSEPEEDRSPPQDDPVVVDEGARVNPMKNTEQGSHARQKVRMPPQNLNTMQTQNLVVIQQGRGSHKKR